MQLVDKVAREEGTTRVPWIRQLILDRLVQTGKLDADFDID